VYQCSGFCRKSVHGTGLRKHLARRVFAENAVDNRFSPRGGARQHGPVPAMPPPHCPPSAAAHPTAPAPPCTDVFPSARHVEHSGHPVQGPCLQVVIQQRATRKLYIAVSTLLANPPVVRYDDAAALGSRKSACQRVRRKWPRLPVGISTVVETGVKGQRRGGCQRRQQRRLGAAAARHCPVCIAQPCRAPLEQRLPLHAMHKYVRGYELMRSARSEFRVHNPSGYDC
jgi:hypothetical protein